MDTMIALNGEKPPRVKEKISGVGMIRGEYLFRKIEKYILLPEAKEFVRNYLTNVCQYYAGNEVWYRTSEFVPQEINVLEGADHIFDEKHYILGMRGIRRSLKFQEAFQEELRVVREVSVNNSNLNILLPYVKDVDELDESLSIINHIGCECKIGIMFEIPSLFFCLDELLERDICNITFGINDLTMLLLGTYRGSDYHNPNHSTVLRLIQDAVAKIRKIRPDIEINIAGYISKEFYDNVQKFNIDNIIIHYKDLPDIFNIDLKDLPDINLVSDIKILTKSRIREREIGK